MFSVTICDDALMNCDLIYSLVRKYTQDNHLNSLIKTFSDPVEVIRDVPSDVYVLDMIMPHLSGDQLAFRLHEKYPSAQFIFVSADKDTALNAHGISACAYLLKPIEYRELSRALDKAVNALKRDVFVVRTADGDRRLRYDDVLYGTCVNRAIEYTMADGEVVRTVCVRGKVIDAYGAVAEHPGFLFLAPATLFNLAQIDVVDHVYVIFAGKRKAYYTQKYYKEVRQKWGEVIGEFRI